MSTQACTFRREDVFKTIGVLLKMHSEIRIIQAGSLWCDLYLNPLQIAKVRGAGIRFTEWPIPARETAPQPPNGQLRLSV